MLLQSVEHLNGVDAEFGDSASPTPNGKQYIRTMCHQTAYLKGTPKGRWDTTVSRRCFTCRLTVGIAKGMPMLCNRHKKTDGSVGMVVVYIPRREVTSQYNTKVVTCQVFPGSSIRL